MKAAGLPELSSSKDIQYLKVRITSGQMVFYLLLVRFLIFAISLVLYKHEISNLKGGQLGDNFIY